MSIEETETSTVSDGIDQVFDEMDAEEKATAAEETQGVSEETTEEVTEEIAKRTTGESQETEETKESPESRFREVESTKGEIPEVVSAQPRFSDELLTRAVEVGISLAHGRSFESEEALLGAVEHYEDMFEKAEAAESGDSLADLPKLDPDTHDPEVIAQFDHLMEIIKQERETNKVFGERLQTIEKQQEEASRSVHEAENVEQQQWFDKQISELPEDFQEALGEGKSLSPDISSKQWANRLEIATQVTVMASGYEAQRMEVPPRDELFAMAARSVLQKEYQQLHEKELAGNLKKRATQHVKRVGGQKASGAQTAEEYAIQELDRKFGKM